MAGRLVTRGAHWKAEEKKTSTKDVYWATPLLLSGSHSPAHLTRLRKTNFAPLLEEEKRVAATVRRAGH